jgi:hypothetical protein
VATNNRIAALLGFAPAYPQLREQKPCEWTRPVELDPEAGCRPKMVRNLRIGRIGATSRTTIFE